MTITRLKLTLEQAEYSALLRIADDELRNPIDQAHYMLRQELERRGLLQAESITTLTGEDTRSKIKDCPHVAN